MREVRFDPKSHPSDLCHIIEDVIGKGVNALVIIGAGVSVASGIPVKNILCNSFKKYCAGFSLLQGKVLGSH